MNKITKSFEINKDLFKVEDNYVCVSDEEIKYGDTWVYISNYGIDEVNNNDVFVLNTIPDSMNWFSKLHNRLNYKKVVFSTQLIYESIPVLNIENETNEIKSIEVEYEEWHCAKLPINFFDYIDMSQGMTVVEGSQRIELKPIVLPNGKIKCKVNYAL